MWRIDGKLSRRQLIRRFGIAAFLLQPVLRSMAVAAATPFAGAPRFVMFFKGGSFYPSSTNPASITDLAGTAIAPLQPHASDIILFKNMSIHGGSPKSDSYKEEHAAGLYGCTTGHSYHYADSDAYYAYTDYESIDVRIARHYQTISGLKDLPISSLHVGGGAHSGADNLGPGIRYISFRNRMSGDGRYSNAIEPIQNPGQVYDQLMQRINLICSKDSNQPSTNNSQVLAALRRKKSLLDLKLSELADAKRAFGMDSEHSRKLDGLVDGWRQAERLVQSELDSAGSAPPPISAKSCPGGARPSGDGSNKQNLDQLSPIHDQMIAMIKLAFEWDLTRVAAFTLSGAASGQSLPSKGVTKAHHTLEHNNDVGGMLTMGAYYSQKFASLLSTLKSIDDGDGKTGLFNSSIVLGMECWSNGATGHYLTNIPFVFAGQGGGKFQTGRIINAGGRNNNDLLVSCQNAAGITSNTFGLASLCKGPII